ncbi:MAG: polysaccharide deacetylase [Gemmatimonadetes bacterium]|nr:polysaccharide deacetylase [Gemmatimonadota bacterium]
MRRLLKRTVERLLVASRAPNFATRRHRSDILVIAYHNVRRAGRQVNGDPSLHLSEKDFEQQLDAILETHDVIPLQSVFERVEAPRRARIVITFDDAYSSALEVAVPMLVQRGLPATIFVAPALLGMTTWWDELGSFPGGLSKQVRGVALSRHRGERQAILKAAECSSGAQADRVVPAIASLEQVREIAQAPGISIGSHTLSHRNLAALDAEDCMRELLESRRWLEVQVPGSIPWIAYPYGLYTPTVARQAADAGYRGAFRVDGGWIRPSADLDAFTLPRFNVPSGMSLDGFRLRIGGLTA